MMEKAYKLYSSVRRQNRQKHVE